MKNPIFPRITIRGHIEADCEDFVLRYRDAFPRITIRGHIEADCESKRLNKYMRPFRGSPSAATLKLAKTDGNGNKTDGFPRITIRGHIEAAGIMPSIIQFFANFPRITIRGHIEAVGFGFRASDNRGAFRGSPSAATLKPMLIPHTFLNCWPFPRITIRGHIEAGEIRV